MYFIPMYEDRKSIEIVLRREKGEKEKEERE
jgi:hypothetical protein